MMMTMNNNKTTKITQTRTNTCKSLECIFESRKKSSYVTVASTVVLTRNVFQLKADHPRCIHRHAFLLLLWWHRALNALPKQKRHS